MADSEGTFGGNGSVFWRVRAKNVRPDTFRCEFNKGVSLQEGHNPTRSDAEFIIAITSPQDRIERTALAERLRKAANALDASKRYVTFTLPVERGRHRQISIRWQSAKDKKKFKASWPRKVKRSIRRAA